MSVKSGSSLLHKLSSRFMRKNVKMDPEENEIRNEDITEDDEDIWMDTLESGSMSSESTSNSMYLKQRPNYHQPLWDKQEITSALSKLPAGELALTLISTLCGEKLNKAVRNVERLDFSHLTEPAQLILDVPQCYNGYKKKLAMRSDNTSTDVEELLRKYPNTCLLVACWLGKVEIVNLLLKKGVQVTYKDCDGRTGLHLAALQNGRVKIIRELLNCGANPNEWDFNNKFTPLHCAAASEDAAALQCLINFGADVNAGLSGRSALHYAVSNNARDCVEILLKAGASPNNPQVYTETPLHVAASLGTAECMSLLLNYGADVRVQLGSARSTALHLAAEEGSPECVKLLLDAGAPCNATNNRGQSALHLAALSQSAETLEILIKYGANVHIEDNDGRNPLHTAVAKATKDRDSAVRILVQASRKLVNKPDKFGYTPLHIAALNENSPIVILLLSKGADVTVKTKGGISALSFIARRTPDVLPRFVSRLDQAISLHDHELGDIDCEIKLDFKPLLSGSGRGETELMLCLIEVGQRHILKHPLCESFLYLKWRRIRKFFLVSLIFHSIFVAIFTSYVAVTFLWDITELSDALFWLVIVFTFILACKELFQLAHGVRTYAKGWENTLQWSVIVFSTLVSLIRPVDSWQHHVAALGILLAWVELMMVVGRFPMFGIYVQMFTQVAINFFKFLGAYMCLIVGFSLGFSVLHNNYKSFKNPLIGLLKTIIMMSGELEFEDVFFDDDAPLLFKGTAHLMLLAFVILVTVILTNLMVGLAVSDIQELRRCAGLDRMVRRAQLVAHLESLLFSKLLDYAPKRIIEPCRNGALLLRFPHYSAINVKPNDPREKRLPRDLVKGIYRLVTEKRNRCKSLYFNTSFRSGFDRDASMKIQRLCSTSSNEPQKAFHELVTQFERYSQNVLMKLDSLTNTFETISRELNLTGHT